MWTTGHTHNFLSMMITVHAVCSIVIWMSTFLIGHFDQLDFVAVKFTQKGTDG